MSTMPYVSNDARSLSVLSGVSLSMAIILAEDVRVLTSELAAILQSSSTIGTSPLQVFTGASAEVTGERYLLLKYGH